MNFSYKALNNAGVLEEGVIEANEKTSAAKILAKNGFHTIHIEEVKQSLFEKYKAKLFERPLSEKKIALFCRQLSILLETESLHRILCILEQEENNPKYTRMIKNIRKEIEEGQPLHKALSKHGKNFSKSVIGLIRAGEESGELKEILERIANYSEKMSDAKEKFQGAMIYPILLMCVTFCLVFLMFTFIIPSFAALFQSFNATLPFPTQMVLAMGDFISKNGLIILLLIMLAGLSFIYLMQNEEYKIKVDEFILRLPICGDFVRHSAWQKILVTMAMLLKSGFRVDEALIMSEDVSDNLVFKKFLHSASKDFEEGHSMTSAFRKFREMPNTHFGLIAAGEKSGRLEEMLLKSAELSEKETEYILKRIESMIGPILTLIVGAIVLFFVLSVALPIFSLTEII